VEAWHHSLVTSVLDGGVWSASYLAVKELPVATGWLGLKSKGPAVGFELEGVGHPTRRLSAVPTGLSWVHLLSRFSK